MILKWEKYVKKLHFLYKSQIFGHSSHNTESTFHPDINITLSDIYFKERQHKHTF